MLSLRAGHKRVVPADFLSVRGKRVVVPPEKIISFTDLGSGELFERAKKLVKLNRIGKRDVCAVDVVFPSKGVPFGVNYLRGDVLNLINELAGSGFRGKVLNADAFFSTHSSSVHGFNGLSAAEWFKAVSEKPIDLNLLSVMRAFLLPNGRIYSTTMQWHAVPLAEAFKKAGFEVRMKKLSEKEILESTQSIRKLYEDVQFTKEKGFPPWLSEEKCSFYRMVAIKRAKE
jgi:hypothetical protein